MLYRKMPKIDDNLSILGFGCMRLPVIDNNPAHIDEEKATKMVRLAIDRGVNYIDTAYPYHGTGMGEPGESEPFVARALRDGYREKVRIATKLPSWLITTREDMDRYLDDQLKRLETDSIDFYLVHALNSRLWSNLVALNITEFLDSAIKDGRIKSAGFSFHDDSVELFKGIVDSYSWDFCQIQYNYIDEDYQAGKEGMRYAAERGLGIVIMEPLKGGSLAENLPDEVMTEMGESVPGRTPVEWSLKWLWNQPEVTVILSGMSIMEHVEENITIAESAHVDSMTEQELATVDSVKEILKRRVKVGCTACGYCMPCPVGVNIPQNFAYYNDFFRFDSIKTKTNARTMYGLVLSPEEKADSCVDCGKCETHCPQGIPIREKLKEVHSTMVV